MSRNDYFDVRSAYLAHYGVKGMKWRFHKYLNQAGRRLQAYGTIAGVGLRRASKKVGAALNKARLALKTKYNPGAIGRRISRAYNIHKMTNTARKIGENRQFHQLGPNTRVSNAITEINGRPVYTYNKYSQTDYSKHNPKQRYNKTGRSHSSAGGRASGTGRKRTSGGGRW